jgi:hypothetical protein
LLLLLQPTFVYSFCFGNQPSFSSIQKQRVPQNSQFSPPISALHYAEKQLKVLYDK